MYLPTEDALCVLIHVRVVPTQVRQETVRTNVIRTAAKRADALPVCELRDIAQGATRHNILMYHSKNRRLRTGNQS